MSIITVFLVNNHPIIRDGLRFLLEAQPDIEVIGDADGERDVVRRIAQLCPDVVITDMSMPRLDGIEMTQQIRRLCPLVQVIILSMYPTNEHVLRALRAGSRGYLLKESAGVEIVDAVRSVHAGHRYLSQKIADWVVDDYVRRRGVREARRTFSPQALSRSTAIT
jgi:DNA-binding NarL/FixJ family response regulator